MQFEEVSLHDVVELTAVEFCSETATLFDVEFSASASDAFPSKGAALIACEFKIGASKMTVVTNIVGM